MPYAQRGISLSWLASRLYVVADQMEPGAPGRDELGRLAAWLETGAHQPVPDEDPGGQRVDHVECEACGYCYVRYERDQNPCPRCNPHVPPTLAQLISDPTAHLGPEWVINRARGMCGVWEPLRDHDLVPAGTWEGLREVWRPYADEAFKHMDGGAIHTIPEMVGMLVDYLVALGGGENGRRVVQMAETIERLKRERDVLRVRLEQAEARRPAPVRGR